MVGCIGVGAGRVDGKGRAGAGSATGNANGACSAELSRVCTGACGEMLWDCGGGSDLNLCARLVAERVRARISARSLSRTDTDELFDAGAVTDGVAEPMDELIDTDDEDGGPDNLGVSKVVAAGGPCVIIEGCGGPSEMGEGVGAETGFQSVCPWVEPTETRLGMSTGARRDGLAGVLTANELRGDMAESL